MINTAYRFTLQRGSSKHYCPNCEKKKFVRYIDKYTNEYLPTQYGKCDRESKCAYHLNPYKDGYSKSIWQQENLNQINWKPKAVQKVKNVQLEKQSSFIPNEILKQTLSGYEISTFIQNLLYHVTYPIESKDIERAISLYNLGTVQNGYRKGAITFPFTDIAGNVRAIQVKQFDKTNHTQSTDSLKSMIEKYLKRNSKPLPKWLDDYNNSNSGFSCLFGEHLLAKYPSNPIALVEAPKSAIIGNLYFGFPNDDSDFLWLAVYNLSSLNLNKCKVLSGREVFLFPDLSENNYAYNLWKDKGETMQPLIKNSSFKTSDILEQIATQQDKKEGKDIADFLIQFDWRLFRKNYNYNSTFQLWENENGYPEVWDE